VPYWPFDSLWASGIAHRAQRSRARRGAGGPAATLAAFPAAQLRETAPPGPKETWLGEAFVHGEDIRRPLGIPRAYPLAEVARVMGFYAKQRDYRRQDTCGRLTLRASDTDFSVGSGRLVEGPAISLLLAASGRKSALEDLSGPGVQVLAEGP
jgi:hypothetical protein